LQQWQYGDVDDNNDVKDNNIVDDNGIMGAKTAMTELSPLAKEASADTKWRQPLWRCGAVGHSEVFRSGKDNRLSNVTDKFDISSNIVVF